MNPAAIPAANDVAPPDSIASAWADASAAPPDIQAAPPHDTDVEAAALGCVLLAGESGDTAAAERMLHDAPLPLFRDMRHRTVRRALDKCAPNTVALVGALRDTGKLDDAGGVAFVADLPNKAACAGNFPEYLATLRDKAARRALLALAEHAKAIAHDVAPVGESAVGDFSELAGRIIQPAVADGAKAQFTVWKPSQFLTWTEPPGSHLLLPAFLSKGELSTIIGQGGLGKSRLSLWLAICQILRWPWCGLETGGEPETWLVLGNENSIGRTKADLAGMFSSLSESERATVEDKLRLLAVLGTEDSDLCLMDLRTQDRVAATIEAHKPGAIILDPLQNIAPGDISKPGDMRDAVRLVLSICRRAAPAAAYLLLHHARTGRTNIAQGIGWDAGNFAVGGKALYSASRCQMNLMPGKADDDRRLVLSCAKANNCARFEPRGLLFDPERFTYSVDGDFNAEAWLADVEGRAKTGQSLCTVAEIAGAVRDGYAATKDLVAHLTEACAVSKPTVERVIRKAVDCEAIKPLTRGRFTLGRRSEKYLEQAT